MAQFIITLISVCLLVQLIFFEDMNGEQMCFWAIVLLCFPKIGIIAYILVGSSLPARIGRSRKTVPPDLNTTGGNEAKVVSGWEETVPMVLNDIETAKKSIDICVYGFARDETGRKVLSKLCDAADRGVKVRVLLDAFGSMKTRLRFFKPLTDKGGEVHKVRRFLTHYRYHRKALIIDGKTVWMGSMNVGEKYIDKHRKKTPWRDTQVRITGEAALEASKLFLYDWRCAADPYAKTNITQDDLPLEGVNDAAGGMHVSLLYCGAAAHKYEIRDNWIDVINKAKETLVIQSPYLLPDAPMLAAIESAVRRGVSVTIMLPEISSGPHLQPLTNYNAAELYNIGARIMLYPGYLHSKTMCRDQKVTCIGSANLDTRSMAINEENCAMIEDVSFSASFMEQFRIDEAKCTEFKPNVDYWNYIKTRFLRAFYWLI